MRVRSPEDVRLPRSLSFACHACSAENARALRGASVDAAALRALPDADGGGAGGGNDGRVCSTPRLLGNASPKLNVFLCHHLGCCFARLLDPRHAVHVFVG
eukprot:SAG11_NODE_2703_length_3074_cov_3.917983_2_plen_101_part_00